MEERQGFKWPEIKLVVELSKQITQEKYFVRNNNNKIQLDLVIQHL